MFRLSRPSRRDVDEFLQTSRELPLSYEPIGLAQQGRSGFRLDQQATIVGAGEQVYRRAVDALHAWAHFDLGWLQLHPRGAAIVPGTVVAVLVQYLGFWSLNGCRVVYAIGSRDSTECGFAYGTLTNHAESGEEIFKVRFDPRSGDVSYVIRAVSRPQAPLAWLGLPLARRLQRRFRLASARALARAVGSDLELSVFSRSDPGARP